MAAMTIMMLMSTIEYTHASIYRTNLWGHSGQAASTTVN